MKAYCRKCKNTRTVFFKSYILECKQCKSKAISDKCLSCGKSNNWSQTGFYCNMTCYYKDLYSKGL